MSCERSLGVHLAGERIGTLSRLDGNDYEFAYAPEPLQRHGSGTPLLSCSLPLRAEPYSPRASRAYVEGLLPEGRQRELIGRERGIAPYDSFALIAELGRDCPGAVVFLPEEETVEPVDPDSIAWLDEDSLAAALSPPASSPALGADRRTRSTLGGSRHKLSLVRDGLRDRWALPAPGLPGTHVIKPQADEPPRVAVNEMFCTAILRAASLPTVQTSLQTIAGRTCLVSPRFDLRWEGRRAPRIHQETFRQALGIGPGDSGETSAPGFAEATGLLRALSPKSDLMSLLQVMFVNHVLGNGDGHGSNFALLFREDGIRLAPFYDVTSTAVYGDPIHAGLVLPDDREPAHFMGDMARMAEECRIELSVFHIQAACALQDVCQAIGVVVDRAEEEGWHTPVIDDIHEVVRERMVRCAEGLGLWNYLDLWP